MLYDLPERRSRERYHTSLQGWIMSGENDNLVACAIWDLSETGVRLVVPPLSDLPLEFELLIPDEGASAKAQLIWAAGEHYGVRFVD
jgi:hypothetical protein